MEYSQMAKTERKKTSAKQDYQDSDLGCSSQSAVPYRLAIALNSGRETICSRIIFRETPYIAVTPAHGTLENRRCRTNFSIFRFPYTGYIHS